MELVLRRHGHTNKATLGVLFINGAHECYTLEEPGIGAIPIGQYSVTIDESARFKRLMPHVLDVPGRSGIRIHCGNTSADTTGCILVGRTQMSDFIGGSRKAFDLLFPKLSAALLAKEVITLKIEDIKPI